MTQSWHWPNRAKLAMSFVINIEEGSEMSVARGDKGPEPVDELGVTLKIPIRNFGNESNYQYGLRAGAPRVFGLFKEKAVRATVTAAAMAIEAEPGLANFVREGGHEVCSHGWRWVHQFSYDEARERDFIAKAVQSIVASTGTRPYGWLSRYLHTERTRRLLAEAGFLYHMDDYSDDVPRWEVVETSGGSKPIVIVPYALDTNDMKFWTAPALRPQDWLDYAMATFQQLLKEGASAPRMMSLGLHLRIIGRPGRIDVLDRFLTHARTTPDVWCATRLELARHFASQVAAPV